MKSVLILLLPLALCACDRTVLISGRVVDVSGAALPGVAVTVHGTEYEGITNGRGIYSVRCGAGPSGLDFIKTGYTPGHLQIGEVARSEGAGVEGDDTPVRFMRIQARDVLLWPLPSSKGVFLFENFRYRELTRTEPSKYLVDTRRDTAEGDEKEKEPAQRLHAPRFVPGTETVPGCILKTPLPSGEEKAEDMRITLNGEAGSPLLICFRMPPWDVQLCRMKQVPGARIFEDMTTDALQELVLESRVWIEESRVQVLAVPVDEPERLLVELRSPVPLSPGVWAVHWGALEGYTSTDPRIFLFRIGEEPRQEEAGESPEDGAKGNQEPADKEDSEGGVMEG